MTFDLNPDYGTHAATLEPIIASLPDNALVIEHGPGLYSSLLLARRPFRMLVIESLPGWSAWTKWIYGSTGHTDVRFLTKAKYAVPDLAHASLLFIDGEARERGTLLQWALDRRAPLIVAHDTEESHKHEYGYQGHMFLAHGYRVTHDSGHRHRTTTWRLDA